ncbi:MAG TPA: 3'-5' exonuclease, partial [Actinomycetota bacterium]|nr:3'-5' exonuclease [Actinomycetota bacterium]
MGERLPRPAPPARSLRGTDWRAVPWVALDFETTGLDPSRDDVVAFGTVPIDRGRIALAGARYREVAPRSPLRPSAVAVHGLRPQDLREAPPIEEVAGELAAALEGRFILAWAAWIEVAFLVRIFGGREGSWRRRTLDVRALAVAARGLPGADRGGTGDLAAVAARLGVPTG